MFDTAQLVRLRRKLARELLVEARVVDELEVERVHVLAAEALAQVQAERRLLDLEQRARVRARELYYDLPLAG